MTGSYLFVLLFAAIVAGIYLERFRVRYARRRSPARHEIADGNATVVRPYISRGFSRAWYDPVEQLRTVMGAEFEKRRLLSRREARLLYAAEDVIRDAKLPWRVMAQVSLGEILSSPDSRAYAAINSKRVDILIISNSGVPIAAIEYQGNGHYQGSAAARDAVKREALRKAGVRFVEVTPEHDAGEIRSELLRIAKLEQAAAVDA